MSPAEPPGGWPIPADAVHLIATAEGCKTYAYPCPAGRWTIGWGHTGTEVAPGLIWSQPQCDRQLATDIRGFVDGVRKICKRPPTDNQLGALVSFAFNLGLSALRNSTLLREHNMGHFAKAAAEFPKWSNATVNGKLTQLPGLVLRRAMEAKLYETV